MSLNELETPASSNEDEFATSYRPMVDTDIGFVLDSWIESFKNSYWAGPLQIKTYRKAYRDDILDLIKRANVLVICNASDVNQLLGFICFQIHEGMSIPIIHYIYIKEVYRGRKMAHGLCRAAKINPLIRFYYTFKTPSVPLKLGRWAGRFDPNLARYTAPSAKYFNSTQEGDKYGKGY